MQKKKLSFLLCGGKGPSGRARRAGQKELLSAPANSQPFARYVGAAGTSSRAQEAADDDSDRDEDQDDVPSFVCQVTPGQEVESLRFDDAHDDDDAEGHASTVSRKPYSAQSLIRNS